MFLDIGASVRSESKIGLESSSNNKQQLYDIRV